MILKTLLSVLLLVSSAAVGAQEEPVAEGSSEAADYHAWRSVSMDMSPEEYTRVYRENRRFLRQVFKSHATETLVSIGVSENVIGVLGAAAALALDQEATLKLNRSKTLAVQFSDMSEEKRAIQIGYTLHW